jgi:glutathionylspermidine synthase
MVKTTFLEHSPETQLQNEDWNWLLGSDTLPYLTNEVVAVKTKEIDAYYEATNELYEMFLAAAQYAIDNQLWQAMGIPQNLVELIELSWNDDRHWHIYGRFDLAGGIDNQPIKLIEFNADTATCIPETAIIQWAHLKANGLNDSQQFNNVYESLVQQFVELRERNADLSPSLLLSTMQGNPEDDTNVSVLGEAAREAGFDVAYTCIDDVEFSESEGIFYKNSVTDEFEFFNFWFKLVPWEFIGYDEPELAQILTQIAKNRKAVIVNPAYTVLFQSKYILKILWDLYPNHPLLLQTDTKPLDNQTQVEKVLLGREGANVRIIESDQNTIASVAGDYGHYAKIYQTFTEFPRDVIGHHYQAGLFWAGEACGLGYRRGGKILDNTAQFVGHVVG